MLTLTEAQVDEQGEIQSSPTATSTMMVTTLYDVIAALNEQVGPEEDDVVTDAVLHLCQSGRLRLLDPSQQRALRCT